MSTILVRVEVFPGSLFNQVDNVFTDVRNRGFCAALLKAAAEKPYHTFTEQPVVGLHITFANRIAKMFCLSP